MSNKALNELHHQHLKVIYTSSSWQSDQTKSSSNPLPYHVICLDLIEFHTCVDKSELMRKSHTQLLLPGVRPIAAFNCASNPCVVPRRERRQVAMSRLLCWRWGCTCCLLLTGSRIITKGARQTLSEQIPKPRLEWEAVADTMEENLMGGDRGGDRGVAVASGGRMRMTPFPIKNTHTL